MINFDVERRRVEVEDRLQRCLDRKLLMGGTKEAIKIAQQAYELAHQPTQLIAP